MIRVGILGGETLAAGELIRLLINHPDVALEAVASEPLANHGITEAHRGLEGDIDMQFSPTLGTAGLDVAFLCGEPWMARQYMERVAAEPEAADLRIIDLTGAYRKPGSHSAIYGLAEHNRKALVRGARFAAVPTAAAMAMELALFPLAKNQLLDPHKAVKATVALADTPAYSEAGEGKEANGQASVELSTRLDPIAPAENRADPQAAAAETLAELRDICPSVSFPEDYITLRYAQEGTSARGVKAIVEISDPRLPQIKELERLFDEAYSDHSFTYRVARDVDTRDVANTNKCLIKIDMAQSATLSPAPVTRITAVADNLLKGGAGNAVHCLNLMFGLSERTGLQLKASAF